MAGRPAGAPDPLERHGRVCRTIVSIEGYAVSLLLVATFVLLIVQVITRYVFSSPLSWTEELARFLLVWLTFLSAGYLMARRLHIRVDLLADRLGRRGALTVDVLSAATVVAASAVMAVAGAQLARSAGGLAAPATGLPMSVVYLAAVIGFALMSAHALADLVTALRHPRAAPVAPRGLPGEGTGP